MWNTWYGNMDKVYHLDRKDIETSKSKGFMFTLVKHGDIIVYNDYEYVIQPSSGDQEHMQYCYVLKHESIRIKRKECIDPDIDVMSLSIRFIIIGHEFFIRIIN